jgi:hypothetical protein
VKTVAVNLNSKVAKIGLAAVAGLAPVPGLSLLLNRKVRRHARRVAGVAVIGAGILVAVPIALYVICKTSPGKPVENTDG